MLANRRDMLSLLPLVGSSAILSTADLSHFRSILESQESTPQAGATDQASFDFWTQGVRNPDLAAGGRSLGNAPRATFVYYDEAQGFLTGSDIGDDRLPDRGDLDIIVKVDHVRFSNEDQKRFVNLEGGSLRLDATQSAPMRSLAERLAWTAIAGFLPENKRLPALKDMTFDPGQTWGRLQSVPLPDGGVFLTWNFFLQKKESAFMKVFDVIRRGRGLLTPIFGLGLPAIAVTALNTVDSIVASLTKDHRTEWLFQSPDLYFYSTKRARDAFEGSKVRLKKGMYVILPSDKLSVFAKEQNKLMIKDGLIVPKGTSGLEVESAAMETIKDITYLTVGVSTKVRSPS